LSVHPPHPGPRPTPSWLPLGNVEHETLGLLKTGKEAEVFLVERRSLDDGRACVLAHKRYRPATVAKGDLEAGGFTQARSFVNDSPYRSGRRARRSRDQRAVDGRTGHGRRLMVEQWRSQELATMQTLWSAGADVPYPVQILDDGVLMEFVGDVDQAAPRLVSARLDPDELARAFAQIVENLHRFTATSVVHADLSPFNVLWWKGRISIIDLPQASDLLLNPHGFDLLHRDVVRMCDWFVRKGVHCNADELFAQLLASAW
jgi:RIO kinase 1